MHVPPLWCACALPRQAMGANFIFGFTRQSALHIPPLTHSCSLLLPCGPRCAKLVLKTVPLELLGQGRRRKLVASKVCGLSAGVGLQQA